MRLPALLLAISLFGPALAQDPQHLEIVLEKRESGEWRKADPGLVFNQGDQVRFRVKANFDGYLYVMDQSTSGKYTLLFPNEEAGTNNHIAPGQEYFVPATQGAFRITGPAGQEIVYWLMSPVELKGEGQKPYVPLPPPPKAGKVPPNITPRCDDTIFRARGECIDNSAGLKTVQGKERLPENLAALPGATSRELLFVRQQGTSVVSAPNKLQGPVVFEFRLAHR